MSQVGEYYSQRNRQTLVVSLSKLPIFGVLLVLINRMMDSKIAQGINRITNSMNCRTFPVSWKGVTKLPKETMRSEKY